MTSKIQTRQNSLDITAAHHDFNKGLNSYALFKIHDKALGEDLVQDTFTKTWMFLVKGGKIVMMKAFLYHVLNNLIIDRYRKQKQQSESLDTLLEKGFEPGEDETDRLHDFIDGGAAIGLILKLPEIYKKVMHMRFTQSMSIGEISVSTGHTKNAVAVQIHRGTEKLRVLYGNQILKIAPSSL